MSPFAGDLVACSFHVTGPSNATKTHIRHLLNAAMACIPAMWKKPSPSTIEQWLDRVPDVCQLMEQMTADVREQTEKKNRNLDFLVHLQGPHEHV